MRKLRKHVYNDTSLNFCFTFWFLFLFLLIKRTERWWRWWKTLICRGISLWKVHDGNARNTHCWQIGSKVLKPSNEFEQNSCLTDIISIFVFFCQYKNQIINKGKTCLHDKLKVTFSNQAPHVDATPCDDSVL